jgi:large subunit ribosomal protein L29
MKASELRTFSADELKGRVRQWRDELFRARFKSQTSETKDTSILVKLRRDIARGNTLLNEKLKAAGPVTVPAKKAVAAAPEVTVAPVVETKAENGVEKASEGPLKEKGKGKGKAKAAKKSKGKEREV